MAAACPTRAAGPGADEEWRYQIQRGDTLIGISQRLLDGATRWPRLQRLNRVTEPRRLKPGSELRIPLAWLRGEVSSAELLQLVGDVRLLGADGQSRPLDTSPQMRPGDTLLTALDASALLRFADGSQLRVSPGSRLTLEQALVLRGNQQNLTTLQLQQGGVESQVRSAPPRPRFEIRSPVLNLGARGTEFRARFDGATQRAEGAVDSGRVAARGAGAAGSERLLEPGFGLMASSAGLGTPVALLPPPALPPALRAERLPVRLAWPQAAGAAGWQAQLFAAAEGGPLLAERRGAQGDAEFGSLPDGEYRLRLRAIDAQGLAGRDSIRPLIVAARPEPPFLSEPAPDAVRVGPRSKLSWAQSSAAARYRLQLASAADFTAPAHDLRDLSATQADVELAPGRWFWRLASVRADGHQGPWSDVQAFVQQPEPPPPAAPSAPLSGPGGDKAADGKLSFRWAAGRPGDRHEFQLARDEAFAERVLERSSTEPLLELDPLPPGRYHLRARVVDARGVAGGWGPTGSFEVPSGFAWWWIPAAVLLLLAL